MPCGGSRGSLKAAPAGRKRLKVRYFVASHGCEPGVKRSRFGLSFQVHRGVDTNQRSDLGRKWPLRSKPGIDPGGAFRGSRASLKAAPRRGAKRVGRMSLGVQEGLDKADRVRVLEGGLGSGPEGLLFLRSCGCLGGQGGRPRVGSRIHGGRVSGGTNRLASRAPPDASGDFTVSWLAESS